MQNMWELISFPKPQLLSSTIRSRCYCSVQKQLLTREFSTNQQTDIQEKRLLNKNQCEGKTLHIMTVETTYDVPVSSNGIRFIPIKISPPVKKDDLGTYIHGRIITLAYFSILQKKCAKNQFHLKSVTESIPLPCAWCMLTWKTSPNSTAKTYNVYRTTYFAKYLAT
jgi:hypothetical protein